MVDDDDNFRMGWRMARVGDLVLLEKPADDRSPKRIDCYLVEVQNFDAAKALGANDAKKCKLDPQRILFSLQYQHNAIPPDFYLVLIRDPRLWFEWVAVRLLGELNRREPHLFDKLHAG
jgi:hypothetical protein